MVWVIDRDKKSLVVLDEFWHCRDWVESIVMVMRLYSDEDDHSFVTVKSYLWCLVCQIF